MHHTYPLLNVQVRTPRLTLVGATDDLLERLVPIIRDGILDPGQMPFDDPMSLYEDSPQREWKWLRGIWAGRARADPQWWRFYFVIMADGSPVGMQDLIGTNFAALGTVATFSWLRPSFRQRGFGTEMRSAILHLAFAGLAAREAVPAAAGFGVLTFGQLCVVGVVQTAGAIAIAFGAASGAHLKALVPPDRRMAANSRLETTSWIAQTAGPPLGGLLISVAGATVTMAVDAVSFLLSALGMSRLQGPEPAPPDRLASRRLRADLASGWRYIFAHRGLRALFCNAMLFGGPVMMTSALLAVFMLRQRGWPRLCPAGSGQPRA